MKKSTIICVDDDESLQTVIGHHLEEQGYRVLTAMNGQELQERLETESADAILLDLMLPDTQGLELIKQIRSKTNMPIIIVSGKDDTMEKIIGLEMGADDYMTKPFAMRELSARIKAVLRRATPNPAEEQAESNKPANEKLKFETWILDRAQYQVFDENDQPLELTIGEFKLLEALILSANRALTREYLFELTRDGSFDAYDRAIDIQIARIRKKLKDDPKTSQLIRTVRGVGYMYCGTVEPVA